MRNTAAHWASGQRFAVGDEGEETAQSRQPTVAGGNGHLAFVLKILQKGQDFGGRQVGELEVGHRPLGRAATNRKNRRQVSRYASTVWREVLRWAISQSWKKVCRSWAKGGMVAYAVSSRWLEHMGAKGVKTRIRFLEEVLGDGQVHQGGIDIFMAEIRRQVMEAGLRIDPGAIPGHHPVHDKGVPQVMEPRPQASCLRLQVRPSDDIGQQMPEGDHLVALAFVLIPKERCCRLLDWRCSAHGRGDSHATPR